MEWDELLSVDVEDRLNKLLSMISKKMEQVNEIGIELDLLKEDYVKWIKVKKPFCPLLNFDGVVKGKIGRFKKRKKYTGYTDFDTFMRALKDMLGSIWEEIDNFKVMTLNVPTIGLNFYFKYKGKHFYLFIPYYQNINTFEDAKKYSNYLLFVETKLSDFYNCLAVFADSHAVFTDIEGVLRGYVDGHK